MKKFLNVEFQHYPSRINLTDVLDLCEVQEKIKSVFEIPRGSAYIQLWKKTSLESFLVTDLNDIPLEYFSKEHQKSHYLTVELFPVESIHAHGNI